MKHKKKCSLRKIYKELSMKQNYFLASCMLPCIFKHFNWCFIYNITH